MLAQGHLPRDCRTGSKSFLSCHSKGAEPGLELLALAHLCLILPRQ